MIRRRLYSYNEPEERLYSTGNEDLDILMERAFCEGYEYAQREFAEKEEGLSTAAKIGIGSAAALATAAGGLYAGKKGLLGKTIGKNINKVILKSTKKGGKAYEGALDDYVRAEFGRGNKKLLKEVDDELKNKILDKYSRKNIAESEVKSRVNALKDELRGKYSGRGSNK